MPLSDRTNLLVQKYICRQYPELEECSLKKKTGFRRSELKGGNHEKVHSVNSNDLNRDLIRAKSRKHNERPRTAIHPHGRGRKASPHPLQSTNQLLCPQMRVSEEHPWVFVT